MNDKTNITPMQGAKQPYKKRSYKDYAPPTASDIEPVLDLAITSLKRNNGRVSKYPADQQGLIVFNQRCLEYFEYIRQQNNNPDLVKKLIPDIEGLTCYIGLTRAGLLYMEQTRTDDWKEAILMVKNAVCSCKKQLALTGQIPPIIAVFDLTNNHSYANTSEFHLVPEANDSRLQSKTLEQIAAEHQQQIDTTNNEPPTLPPTLDI